MSRHHDATPSPGRESSRNTYRTPAARTLRPVIAALGAAALMTACGSGEATRASAPSPAAAPSATSASASASEGTSDSWSGTPTDPKKIPLGDGKVEQTGAKKGYAWSCRAADGTIGGAQKEGPWIDTKAKTWDSTAKVSVQGKHTWPQADYSESASGADRVIKSTGLPTHEVTGTFPVQPSDPAYQYDFNPNTIKQKAISYTLPLHPTAAAHPSCLAGQVGILKNGVLLFAGFDGEDRDAVAHETQDACDGHPAPTEEYHYHDIPSCLLDATEGKRSTLVGYALDGYGIYVERDAKGNLPTNADLDECHGRTSTVEWNGKQTSIYHYVATTEFPYTAGCFHGTNKTPGPTGPPPAQKAPAAAPTSR